MAISTIYTFLMQSTNGTTFTKLLDIYEFPDLGGEPEQIDVTTLTDTMRHYINGVQDTGSMQFSAYYKTADYNACKALEGKNSHYAVWFGGDKSGSTVNPSGGYGKFAFDGQLSVFVNGGGVNDPVSMTITIAPSTDITYTAGTSA